MSGPGTRSHSLPWCSPRLSGAPGPRLCPQAWPPGLTRTHSGTAGLVPGPEPASDSHSPLFSEHWLEAEGVERGQGNSRILGIVLFQKEASRSPDHGGKNGQGSLLPVGCTSPCTWTWTITDFGIIRNLGVTTAAGRAQTGWFPQAKLSSGVDWTPHLPLPKQSLLVGAGRRPPSLYM